MQWPTTKASQTWLQSQGLEAAQAKRLLMAMGGRPDDALAFASGRESNPWSLLPKAVSQGDAGYFKDWTLPQTIDALHKLCHDLMVSHTGATPRFFSVTDLPSGAQFSALSEWSRALSRSTRTMDHPFNAGLMLESLVGQAQSALNSRHEAGKR
jgi:DNA polymerase-3 subunit delta'